MIRSKAKLKNLEYLINRSLICAYEKGNYLLLQNLVLLNSKLNYQLDFHTNALKIGNYIHYNTEKFTKFKVLILF